MYQIFNQPAKGCRPRHYWMNSEMALLPSWCFFFSFEFYGGWQSEVIGDYRHLQFFLFPPFAVLLLLLLHSNTIYTQKRDTSLYRKNNWPLYCTVTYSITEWWKFLIALGVEWKFLHSKYNIKRKSEESHLTDYSITVAFYYCTDCRRTENIGPSRTQTVLML